MKALKKMVQQEAQFIWARAQAKTAASMRKCFTDYKLAYDIENKRLPSHFSSMELSQYQAQVAVNCSHDIECSIAPVKHRIISNLTDLRLRRIKKALRGVVLP
ncbi:hypothetical protein ORI99_01765 [Alishewanella sp. SMS9]|nr:hypothetical protein [Alishewanella sp. SMS9]